MKIDPYLFYTIMNYPLPRQREFFSYRKSDGLWGSAYPASPSRHVFDENYSKQCEFIAKWQRVWKTVPFLEAVYVSDKLSFNAQGDAKDIDLFLIANVGRVWHVRLRTSIFVCVIKFLQLLQKSEYTFTLNFTVARDFADLQSIKLVPHDPYLIYWIAHLVPIYHQFEEHEINIRKENKRIQYYLPDHPLHQTIFLDVEQQSGRSRLGRKGERLSQGIFGDFVEWLIKLVWIPGLLRYRRKMGLKGEGVIIASKMVKFHYDKRENYALKWKIATK